MTTEVELRPAKPEDREYIKAVLANNDLPTADIAEVLDCLYVCERGNERIGVGGLERYHGVALLRSVVIEEPVRGNGYGTRLCKQLLDRAQTAGISTVYLLTTTADEFFRRFSFAHVDRESVPESIRGTSEFEELCPSSAACMKRELRP